MNEITSLEFRDLILKNKNYIYGSKFRTGQTLWKFAGAGETNLMFRSKKSGLDVTQASEGKFWVEYKNINPVIKGALISEIKAKSINDRIKAELNGTGEVSEDVSIKKTYDQLREEIGGKRLASQKVSKDLGFIPGNEYGGY